MKSNEKPKCPECLTPTDQEELDVFNGWCEQCSEEANQYIMQALKIEIPKGHEVESFDKDNGVIKFKETPKDIKERINGLDDIFKLNGTTKSAFDRKWFNHEKYEKAHALELLIVSAYNEGKKPDWTDGTAKYYPWFNMPSPSGGGFSFGAAVRWNTYSDVGARQVFVGPNAKANMLDAVEKFLPQYKDSRTL